MKFIDSNYEILEQEPNVLGIYKQVEKAARVSYKSEDKICDGSAERMVDTLIKNKHLACLEHGTVYLKFPYLTQHCNGTPEFWSRTRLMSETYYGNPYSYVSGVRSDGMLYVTTNLRVLVENDVLSDLKYVCEPTEYHEKRYTVKFILSAGIGREFTRHRAFSFMQESTRFCNYSKGKFNSELTFIIPQWIYDVQADHASYINQSTGQSKDWLMDYRGEKLINMLVDEDEVISSYINLLQNIENDYLFCTTTNNGHQLKAQEARGILPLDIKSELIMTGFAKDWIHFFNLRSYIGMTGKPHPDAQILADNLLKDFLERGYIKNEDLYKKA